MRGETIIGLFTPPVSLLPSLELRMIAFHSIFVEIENARIA